MKGSSKSCSSPVTDNKENYCGPITPTPDEKAICLTIYDADGVSPNFKLNITEKEFRGCGVYDAEEYQYFVESICNVDIPGLNYFTRCCMTDLCNNIPISTLISQLNYSKTLHFSMSLEKLCLLVMAISFFNYF